MKKIIMSKYLVKKFKIYATQQYIDSHMYSISPFQISP